MFKRLILTNIKSFAQAYIPLSNFTLVLGTNASGKSNLRDAFRFLHGLSRGYKLADVLGGKYEGGDQVWQGIRGGPYEFITQGEAGGFVVASLEPHVWYTIAVRHLSDKPPLIFSEILNVGVDDLYEAEETEGQRLLKTRIKAGGDFRKGQVESLPSDEAVLTQIADYYRGRTDEGIQAVKAGVLTATTHFTNMQFLDLSPNALREPSYPGQNQLGDRGENLSTVLQYLIEEKEHKETIIEWLRELTPMDVADLKFQRDSRGRVSLALVEHNKRITSVESASDGTLRFLAYLALAFSTETPTTCFIEEIDNGIHPSRLKLLVELIETQTKRRNLQIIATSHSPALLNLLSEESLNNALLVYRTEDSPHSNVKPLHELPNFKEIVERRRPGALMESGWFENTVEALEFDKAQPA